MASTVRVAGRCITYYSFDDGKISFIVEKCVFGRPAMQPSYPVRHITSTRKNVTRPMGSEREREKIVNNLILVFIRRIISVGRERVSEGWRWCVGWIRYGVYFANTMCICYEQTSEPKSPINVATHTHSQMVLHRTLLIFITGILCLVML